MSHLHSATTDESVLEVLAQAGLRFGSGRRRPRLDFVDRRIELRCAPP
ncbi:hypothetical protein [Rhodococcus sp. Q]|nr:hypothetical protein [Rhodococcus sp. Q]